MTALDTQPIDALIGEAVAYLESHSDQTVTLAELGWAVGMSPAHLQRRFKERMGMSPREYALAMRVADFKSALRDSPGDVLGGALDAGFGSQSQAYQWLDSFTGMTPASYGAGGTGANIEFAISETPVGMALVATTQRGVCAVTLGDSREALEHSLRAEFPNASIQNGESPQLKSICLGLDAHVAGDQTGRIPLDIRATEFQWTVWRQLRGIARGQTATYSQVAAAIGRPSASRAVANACGSNKVAMLIPCHRVVRTDGTLGGYRWGIGRKAELLDIESTVQAGQS
jgi:AraC family transcriptional regulator of adaptative response/methylated-DNA-[protein]-cysteine methyltransferase